MVMSKMVWLVILKLKIKFLTVFIKEIRETCENTMLMND